MTYYDLSVKQLLNIKTLKELKASGYAPIGIKDELRKNLAHQEEGKDQEILRIGCIHPGQYHFFQIALQVVLDSFHSDSEY
jgi:hypothetical protein